MKELSEMSLEELWQLFPIVLKEYDQRYPAWYEKERKAIVSLLGEETIRRISHIGSTAVQGCNPSRRWIFYWKFQKIARPGHCAPPCKRAAGRSCWSSRSRNSG